MLFSGISLTTKCVQSVINVLKKFETTKISKNVENKYGRSTLGVTDCI
ncbi:MAG: hypothetical protein RHS_1972 [Robinsoniella sp. RHS]|nr:MAG: hypothetical protein RHS_1972 [Robinsoniella sp. RHS]